MRRLRLGLALVGVLTLVRAVHAQGFLYEEQFKLDDSVTGCFKPGPAQPLPPPPDPLRIRMLSYVELAAKHRLCGLASYYSASLEGTLTANGERYRKKVHSAAHLTLPLGCWIEVTARATGKRIRCRVNDRGPYAAKFILDLSYSAAHELGVDDAEDRHVDVRIIALPGEEPLPEGVDWSFLNDEPVITSASTR